LRTFVWLLFFFIALSPCKAKAQHTKSIAALSFDEKCVSILLESKIAVTDMDSLIIQMIDKNNYSAQIKVILSNGLEGQLLENTAYDLEIQEALNHIQQQWLAAEKNRLNSICNKYSIDRSSYEVFLQRWKTDISFQQSLRPFIEKKLQP
jgi:hypothetical protein